MSVAKKNNPAEDLMDSLLTEVKRAPSKDLFELADSNSSHESGLEKSAAADESSPDGLFVNASDLKKVDSVPDGFEPTRVAYESTKQGYESTKQGYETTKHPYDNTKQGYESTKNQWDGTHASADNNAITLDDADGMNPSLESLFDTNPIVEAKSLEHKPESISLSDEKPQKKPTYTYEPLNLDDEDLPLAENFGDLKESEETIALGKTSISSVARPMFSDTELNPRKDVEHSFDRKAKDSILVDQERTVAVTGFQNLNIENHDDKVKVSIGQNRSSHSSGYASWGGGGAEASLGQADNLRMAQEKILELERENEKLRLQNDELISASDIIRERSDLLTAQVTEFKNDKEGLEESFKNEVALLKAHLQRKDVEFQKSQIKIDDLESRLKFDMKKIRIRERELENRLELIRAEKNAVTKSKDDQILDLRRKMDVLQMEVESYRQKCVDLNKLLENNQDSFKRTTRALRLAMANLELQEENKVAVSVALKKVD